LLCSKAIRPLHKSAALLATDLPAPFFTRYRPKGKEPEGSQAKMIGGMIRNKTVTSALFQQQPHMNKEIRIIAWTQTVKAMF